MIWLSAAMITVLISLISYGIYKKTSLRKQKKRTQAIVSVNEENGIENYLNAATLFLHADDKKFYSALNQGIWNFFRENLSLTGSDQSKSRLASQLHGRGIDSELIDSSVRILQLSEAAGFTDAAMNDEKKEILETTRKLLTEIREKLL
jgi:hypothetical protein